MEKKRVPRYQAVSLQHIPKEYIQRKNQFCIIGETKI